MDTVAPPAGSADQGSGQKNPSNPWLFGARPREWLGGGIAALLGTAVAVGMLTKAATALRDGGHGLAESLIGMAVGLLFAYIGYWLLLWKDIIQFDPAQGTYRRTRGWGPWARVQEGTRSDLDRIRLEMTTNKTGRFCCATLRWKTAAPKRPELELIRDGHISKTTAEAERVGAAMRIMVDDSALQAWKHAEAKAEAKRAVWSQWLRPYKHTAVIALGVLVANSLVPGLSWRDRWTDGSGRQFERQSTLFHTLTRVFSAGRLVGYADNKWFVLGNIGHRSGYFAAKEVPASPTLEYHWSFGFGPFPDPETKKGRSAGMAPR